MYRLFIALRYLLHKRINLLAVIGVAVSVTVLFVVHSVLTGFAQQIVSYIRGNLSDLTVETYDHEAFAGYEEYMAKLEKLPNVAAASPRFEGLALVRVGDRSGFRYGEFQGIDLQRECKTTKLAEYWRKAEAEEKTFDTNHAAVNRPTWGPEAGKKNARPAIVGVELVKGRDMSTGKLRSLGVGDGIVLISPSSTGLEAEVLPFTISGKFKSGNAEYDSQMVLIPLADAQAFMRKPGKINSIAIHVDDYQTVRHVQAAILGIATLDEILQLRNYLRQAGALTSPPAAVPLESELTTLRANYSEWRATGSPNYVASCIDIENAYFDMMDQLQKVGALDKFSKKEQLKTLRNALADRAHNALGPNWRVQTSEDKMRTWMTAVDIERGITVIVQSFVFLLTWALIYSILSSSVVEKIKDIGILRSLGATKYGVMSIFLLNGLIVGFIGSALGIVGGTLFCDHINQIADVIYNLTGLRVFPPDVYYFDKIPVDSNPMNWAIVITVIALLVSVAGAYFPAHKAAKLNPVDALRYE